MALIFYGAWVAEVQNKDHLKINWSGHLMKNYLNVKAKA
jgi:hypothetical protein